MDFLTQYKNALFLIGILLAQAIALAVQVRSPLDPAQPDGPSVRLIRMWAMTAVTPVERMTHAIGYGTATPGRITSTCAMCASRTRTCSSRLTRMRIDEAAIAEDALQGRRLQAMLGFRESYVGSTVAAQVIGASGSEQSHILTIDKGSRDGLRPDMAVITQDGVVGKLRDVFPPPRRCWRSTTRARARGWCWPARASGRSCAARSTGRVQIGNLTADSRIQPGEQVLTSGGDQVYPRGLPVGVVESIAPDPDHQPYTAIRVIRRWTWTGWKRCW